MHYVYLLRLSNNEIYTGYTTNLKDRFRRHQQGSTKFTSDHQPESILWYSAFSNKTTALAFEKYLKGSSGKAFRNKHLVHGTAL